MLLQCSRGNLRLFPGGGVERMDSKEAGSQEGMDALMAKHADAIYAKASLKNVRVDSLKSAAHHLRQSADAVATGVAWRVHDLERSMIARLMRQFRPIWTLGKATTSFSTA